MNVMFNCVCECTDFKHNFKSEKETKIALGSLAELPRAVMLFCSDYNIVAHAFKGQMVAGGNVSLRHMLNVEWE